VSVAAIAQELRPLVGAGVKVQIERAALGGSCWNGYPLAMTDDLVLMRTLDDFDLDGFAVLRLEDITRVRAGDAERFFDHVLRAEGLLDALPTPPPIRLDALRSALEDVRRLHGHAILECEALDEPEFYLGELVSVDEGAVSLRYITVTGVVESATTEVPLEDITIVRFDERYIRYFAKYARDERLFH
jgi:hypothetical protein